MVNSADFNIATSILHRLTCSSTQENALIQEVFSSEYDGQQLITTALKIIHKVVKEGSSAQQEELSRFRHEVVALNSLLLNSDELKNRVRLTLGIEMKNEEAEKLEKMEIALPQTKFEKMIFIASLIPRTLLSLAIDIALLPLAGLLLLFMLTKPDFDTKQPKEDKTPILLLHGSGFNESEWVLGRQFLKKEQYGSVFSLSYDGLLTNDSLKGIDDYAVDKVREKILTIKKSTKQNSIILIGHSMGGMVAGCYAERHAAVDEIEVRHVISIASPWQGSPIVNTFISCLSSQKRYNQMSSENTFRKELVAQALASERTEKRSYYSIGSETDFLVPGSTSTLTEDPRRQRMFSYLGHYGIIASQRVWGQINYWLDDIYAKESSVGVLV